MTLNLLFILGSFLSVSPIPSIVAVQRSIMQGGIQGSRCTGYTHRLSYIEANVPKGEEPWFPIPALVAPSLWSCLLCVVVSLWHGRSAQTSGAEPGARTVLEVIGLPWSKLLLKSLAGIAAAVSWGQLPALPPALSPSFPSRCLWPPAPSPLLAPQGIPPSISSKGPRGCWPARLLLVPSRAPLQIPAWRGLAQVPHSPQHAQKCLGSCWGNDEGWPQIQPVSWLWTWLQKSSVV